MSLRSLEYLPSVLRLLARDLLERGAAPAGPASAEVVAPFTNIAQADWVEAVRLWNAHGRTSIASLARRGCPACGAQSGRRLFESYDGYGYEECADCGCWYVPLKVEASLFEGFFARCPEARAVAERSFASRSAPEYEAASHERIGGYLDTLAPLVAAGGSPAYLDLGCGLGHSLASAVRRGFTAVGTESSPECLRIARGRGLDVRGDAEPLPEGPFRLVSFWESLEHMVDPSAALSACRPLLEPGGLLAFTVPNLLSPILQLQRGDCSIVHGGYDTPGHVNLFGPAQLERLLARAGFALLDLDGQYGMNPIELAAYAAGRHRGASELLAGGGGAPGLDGAVAEAIVSAGPALTLLERIGRLSPILFGIACPAPEAARHAAAIRAMQEARRARLVAEIDAAGGPVAEIDALRRELAVTRENFDRLEIETATYRAAVRALRNPGATLRRLLGGS